MNNSQKIAELGFHRTFSVYSSHMTQTITPPHNYRAKRHPDTVSSLCTSLRNAYRMRRTTARFPNTNFARSMIDVLIDEGYVNSYECDPRINQLTLHLKYNPITGRGVLNDIRPVSKPSRRVVKTRRELRPFQKGLGLFVLKTSKGVLTSDQCVKENVGGEVLFSVF